jgi:uncharacterized DUF497 family protein
MAWTWDPKKEAANRRKHRVSFQTAELVFEDPFHLSAPDPHPDGDRWRTLGMVGHVLLFVVHTEPVEVLGRDEPIGRIIGARKATARETRAYEARKF